MPLMRAVFIFLSLITFVAACDNGSTPPGTGGGGEMGPDMAFLSACGHPGDTGNNKGVGKFCMTDDDCAGNEASICSSINNDTAPPEQRTFFCVKPLCATTWSSDDIKDYCGDGAVCLKNELGTACGPKECAPK
jgi:hypothetical protein